MSVNKKLHILFISSWFPTKTNRFNGDFVQRHAQAVSTLNKVTVFHAVGTKNQLENSTEDLQLTENYREVIHYYPKSKFRIVNLWRKMKAYNYLRREINPDFDLIHANVIDTHLIWALYQKFWFGKKYVLTEHSTDFYINLPLNKKLLALLIGNNAEMILPVSKRLQQAMEEKGIKNKFKVVPNVVDTNLFVPDKKENQEKTVFLHISMLREDHKNISGQLQAAKKLFDKGYIFEYQIGGNGDLSRILEFIKSNNAHYIKPFGALPHHDVAKKMTNADCFVLFSNKENQPCVIIEAFATGTPVIATDVGGVGEYFPSEFGLLIQAENTDQLVHSLETIILNKNFAPPEEMHRYAEDNFSPLNIATEFDRIYRVVLDSGISQKTKKHINE